MKSNTKSSVTLPAAELAVVKRLQRTLKLKTKVEVVRAGLRLLEARRTENPYACNTLTQQKKFVRKRLKYFTSWITSPVNRSIENHSRRSLSR